MMRARVRARDNRGFTLTELIVVCSIVGLMMLVALPKLLSVIRQTNSNSSKQILAQALNVSDNYFRDKNSYIGFNADTTPADNIPDWPQKYAPEINWVDSSSWIPTTNEDKAVSIRVIGSDTLGLTTYSHNGKFYCIKVSGDVVYYGIYPPTGSSTNPGTDKPFCVDNATNKNRWPAS